MSVPLGCVRRGTGRRAYGRVSRACAPAGGRRFLPWSFPAAPSVSRGVNALRSHFGGLVSEREVINPFRTATTFLGTNYLELG